MHNWTWWPINLRVFIVRYLVDNRPMSTTTMSFRTIALVVTGLDVAGAEIQVVSLARHLRARGWRVHVISLTPPKAFASELAGRGIFLHSLNMRPGIADPRGLGRLAALVHVIRPQVLHSHMKHANLLTRLTRLSASYPVSISTIHSIRDGGRITEAAYRITDPLCDMTTHVSKAGVYRYVQAGAVPSMRIRHIPNGIDVTAFRPRISVRTTKRHQLGVEDSFVWIAVGRFEGAKDHANLVGAFELVAREHSNSVLLMVGHGPEERHIRLQVRKLGLEHRVRFLGLRNDIPDLMNAADAYVLSSKREGLPLVLLEAAASALPVVTTMVGGTAEIVLDEKTGFVVPPESPSRLAEAMLRMSNLSANMRTVMGVAGRNRVDTYYAFARVVTEWERLYDELMRARTRP
jgi:glycosyltransferase involved in cell wall biosynthesis